MVFVFISFVIKTAEKAILTIAKFNNVDFKCTKNITCVIKILYVKNRITLIITLCIKFSFFSLLFNNKYDIISANEVKIYIMFIIISFLILLNKNNTIKNPVTFMLLHLLQLFQNLLLQQYVILLLKLYNKYFLMIVIMSNCYFWQLLK